MSYKKALLLISIIILGIASAILYGRKELKIPELSLRSSDIRADMQVGCLLIARAGDRHLRLNFYVAAEDRGQRDDLLNKIPAIKHDLLMSANTPEFLSALEGRDFESIREHLLTTVNQYAETPVDNLFFESYYFD